MWTENTVASFSGSATRPPTLLRIRSSNTYVIITVATAIFTDLFVYGIVVPVLPFSLTERAHVEPSGIQTWISIFLAVYGGALLVSSPIVGWLADQTASRRWPMILGLVALAGATVMLCIGSSIAVLAAGRVLQGFSAGVVWVVGLALLVDTVGPEGIGGAMGYVGISMSLAVLLAPLLGGVVFAASGYYAVWYMAFGLIVLDMFLRVTMIEKKIASRWLPAEDGTAGAPAPPIDDEKTTAKADGEKSGTLRSDSPVTPTNEPVTDRSSKPTSPSEAAAATVVEESTHSNPAPPYTTEAATKLPPVFLLLSSRRLLVALWATIVESSLLTAFDSILPLFVHKTFHWNSIGAGLAFLPIIAPTFAGPLVGGLSDRHGPRWLASAGFLLACPMLVLMRLVQHDSLDQKVLLCALLALVGASLTLVMSPLMAEITYVVAAKAQRRPPGYFGPNGAYAQAYSLFNMAWAGGTLVGPLLAGLVNQNVGWGATTLILGCVSAFTAVPTCIWTGGSILKRRRMRRAQLSAPAEAG